MIRHGKKEDILAYAERLFNERKYEESLQWLHLLRGWRPDYEGLRVEGLIQSCMTCQLELKMSGLTVGK